METIRKTLKMKVEELGYTIEDGVAPRSKVVLNDGELVFEGDCYEVVEWLKTAESARDDR